MIPVTTDIAAEFDVGPLSWVQGEIDQALDAGVVTLHSKIKARHTEMDAEGNMVRRVIDTSPGTSTPASSRYRRIPTAIVSLAATIAVGGFRRFAAHRRLHAA